MYHAKFWPSCLFETWKQSNNIYCWHWDTFPNGFVLTVYLKQHPSLPADQDSISTNTPFTTAEEVLSSRWSLGVESILPPLLLAGSGSWCAWGWLRGRKLTHLLPGFSWSRSLSTDLPSMSGGTSSPAMSKMVGARSMFRTICGTLWRDKMVTPGTQHQWRAPPGLLFPIPALPGLRCVLASHLVA